MQANDIGLTPLPAIAKATPSVLSRPAKPLPTLKRRTRVSGSATVNASIGPFRGATPALEEEHRHNVPLSMSGLSPSPGQPKTDSSLTVDKESRACNVSLGAGSSAISLEHSAISPSHGEEQVIQVDKPAKAVHLVSPQSGPTLPSSAVHHLALIPTLASSSDLPSVPQMQTIVEKSSTIPHPRPVPTARYSNRIVDKKLDAIRDRTDDIEGRLEQEKKKSKITETKLLNQIHDLQGEVKTLSRSSKNIRQIMSKQDKLEEENGSLRKIVADLQTQVEQLQARQTEVAPPSTTEQPLMIPAEAALGLMQMIEVSKFLLPNLSTYLLH